MVTYFGYDTILTTNLWIADTIKINYVLKRNKYYPAEQTTIHCYWGCRPMLDIDNPTRRTYSRETLNQMPW